jgi:hypothetical protein
MGDITLEATMLDQNLHYCHLGIALCTAQREAQAHFSLLLYLAMQVGVREGEKYKDQSSLQSLL